MHADGKSALASVSKWNSGKVNCCTLISLHFYLQMLLVIDLFQYKESQWAFSASHEIQRKMMIHASIILFKIF